MMELIVNGQAVSVDAAPETALLWVLREHLGLTGSKPGCGVGQCGACTVHVDGQPAFSCITPIEAVEGSAITTIEGLSASGEHPLQQAWVTEQVPQCGYCQSGQIMRAAALLADNPQPSRGEIVEYMSPNLCRCGTYPRIVKAITRAAQEA
jgi:isoquinoline 1-oxidoreductase alpha subunit